MGSRARTRRCNTGDVQGMRTCIAMILSPARGSEGDAMLIERREVDVERISPPAGPFQGPSSIPPALPVVLIPDG